MGLNNLNIWNENEKIQNAKINEVKEYSLEEIEKILWEIPKIIEKNDIYKDFIENVEIKNEIFINVADCKNLVNDFSEKNAEEKFEKEIKNANIFEKFFKNFQKNKIKEKYKNEEIKNLDNIFYDEEYSYASERMIIENSINLWKNKTINSFINFKIDEDEFKVEMENFLKKDLNLDKNFSTNLLLELKKIKSYKTFFKNMRFNFDENLFSKFCENYENISFLESQLWYKINNFTINKVKEDLKNEAFIKNLKEKEFDIIINYWKVENYAYKADYKKSLNKVSKENQVDYKIWKFFEKKPSLKYALSLWSIALSSVTKGFSNLFWEISMLISWINVWSIFWTSSIYKKTEEHKKNQEKINLWKDDQNKIKEKIKNLKNQEEKWLKKFFKNKKIKDLEKNLKNKNQKVYISLKEFEKNKNTFVEIIEDWKKINISKEDYLKEKENYKNNEKKFFKFKNKWTFPSHIRNSENISENISKLLNNLNKYDEKRDRELNFWLSQAIARIEMQEKSGTSFLKFNEKNSEKELSDLIKKVDLWLKKLWINMDYIKKLDNYKKILEILETDFKRAEKNFLDDSANTFLKSFLNSIILSYILNRNLSDFLINFNYKAK